MGRIYGEFERPTAWRGWGILAEELMGTVRFLDY